MPTETQLDTYRRSLEQRQALLRDEHSQRGDDHESVELDQSRVGRVSRVDALQQHAMHTATGHRREAELRAIAAALQRIEDESFGWCTDCGDEIAPARLGVDAAVPHCITCADRRERQ